MVPEMFDPQSFRGALGHNTNLWCTRARHLFPPTLPHATMVPPSWDPRSYFLDVFAQNTAIGMASRACHHLPDDMLVFSRCRCTNPDSCGEEEAAVLEVAQKGLMHPMAYALDPVPDQIAL